MLFPPLMVSIFIAVLSGTLLVLRMINWLWVEDFSGALTSEEKKQKRKRTRMRDLVIAFLVASLAVGGVVYFYATFEGPWIN